MLYVSMSQICHAYTHILTYGECERNMQNFSLSTLFMLLENLACLNCVLSHQLFQHTRIHP